MVLVSTVERSIYLGNFALSVVSNRTEVKLVLNKHLEILFFLT